MKKYSVVAVGNAIVDILAKVDDELLKTYNITKGIMSLITEDEADRIYNFMPSAIESSGGSAANTIAGIASLGGSAAFIGKVKDDDLGKIFAHDLKALDIVYKTPFAKDGPGTAKSFVLVTKDAQRTMLTHLGATKGISTNDIDPDLIENCKVTYLEGYLWDEEHAKQAMLEAVKLTKQYGGKVALSLSDPFCVDRHKSEFETLIEKSVDILFANEDEIKSLTNQDDIESAMDAIRGKAEIVSITRGKEGAIIVTTDGDFVIAAEDGLKVVDTTGAGDLYAAGFLYAYTEGFDIDKCGRYGALAASEIIQHLGARPEENLNQYIKKAA